MRITELANELKVSRQYVHKTAQNLGLNLKRKNGIIFLSKSQIEKLTKIIGV